MIDPTIGRLVWFRGSELRAGDDDDPLPACVTKVHTATCVNLHVFGVTAGYQLVSSVTLRQPEDERPEGAYCEWMPYQVKKDFGSESGERTVGTEKI